MNMNQGPNFNVSTYTLFSQPFLDKYNQCYKNIVTINMQPKGPLSQFVRRVTFDPLSPFKQPGPCNPTQTCGLALTSFNTNSFTDVPEFSRSPTLALRIAPGCCNNLMVVDEVPHLFGFLLSNGYKIDTSITKMLNGSDLGFHTENANKLICMITYTG